jgi:uncharacterized protein YdeI (YjbR/CyaY-like superfamily)
MPDFVRQALEDSGLMDAYNARPPYQRNDWLGWIARAKKEETRQKRLASMLRELEQGHGYMGMDWRPRA